jgi:hypothetical protein
MPKSQFETGWVDKADGVASRIDGSVSPAEGLLKA